MTYKTRATLAVSILALVAGGPLSAQTTLPFPAEDAPQDGLLDGQPWASEGLASQGYEEGFDNGLVFQEPLPPTDMPMTDPNMAPADPYQEDLGAGAAADIFTPQEAPTAILPPADTPTPPMDSIDSGMGQDGMSGMNTGSTFDGATNGLAQEPEPQVDTSTIFTPQPTDPVPLPEPLPDVGTSTGFADDGTVAPNMDAPVDDPYAQPQEQPWDDGGDASTGMPMEDTATDPSLPLMEDGDMGVQPAPMEAPAADAPFSDVTNPDTTTPLVLPDVPAEDSAAPADEAPMAPEAGMPLEAEPAMDPADQEPVNPMDDPMAAQDPTAVPAEGEALPQEPTNTPAENPVMGTPTDVPAEAPADAPVLPDMPMEDTTAPVDAAPMDPTMDPAAQPTTADEQAPLNPQPAPIEDTPAEVSANVQEQIAADPEVQESIAVLESIATNTGEPLAAVGGQPVGQPVVRTIEDTRNANEEFTGSVSATSIFEQIGTTSAADELRRAEERRERDVRRARLEGAGLGAIAGLVVGAIISDRQEVVATAPERVVVVDRSTNVYQIWRDDDSILRRPGMREETTVYPDGSVRTVLTDPNGTRVETIRSATGRVLKRERIVNDRRVVIIDDLRPIQQVDIRTLPQPRIPRVYVPRNVDPVLGAQLIRTASTQTDRSFSLGQIRNVWEVRRLVPVLDTDPVLFATGSSALGAQQATALSGLAAVMLELLRQNPSEMFLVEGHTDAVGGAAFNLALSDRRAESVAQALVDYFGIPPENLVFQGYGESLLAVPTQTDEARNRRVEIRRITPLLDPRAR